MITSWNNTEIHLEGENFSSKLEKLTSNSFVFVWFCISCLTTKSPFLNWRFFFLRAWLPILTRTLFHHLWLPYPRYILEDKHLNVIDHRGILLYFCLSSSVPFKKMNDLSLRSKTYFHIIFQSFNLYQIYSDRQI